MNENHFKVIGVMSGSSLDGLDVAYCEFDYDPKRKTWNYDALNCKTFKFPDKIKINLSRSTQLNVESLLALDAELGEWIGNELRSFIDTEKIKPDYISSHGHTVFHNPDKGYSLQIGSPEFIYAITGIPVISDFRNLDIALGGQGAPLVPAGDYYLFHDFDACLNLGGICNVTILNSTHPLAGDICGCNQLLNYLVSKLDMDFDPNGENARSGTKNNRVIERLLSDSFHFKSFPKSISNEYIQENILPLLDTNERIENLLNSCCEYIAISIQKELANYLNQGNIVLVTGGGAFNLYLMECIMNYSEQLEFIIPDKKIVSFKEAIIFAFLGVLRISNKVNCFASVTGASQDSVSGKIIGI